MGRIHVLPENVANKIAAGEVVERPASVVKELLENALDAGASRIRISVEAGGKRFIQVNDNGCGMLRDDALLAFERHATSKIKDAEDLLNISTLGFRGEALPSIASVSRLHLETHTPEEPGGTVIDIAGGRILNVAEAGLPAGTSITVRDLFFNTPARRKFLRSESTELSHIASLVTHYSLAHPDKHFELHSATHAMLVVSPVASPAERLYQVFGRETLDQMIPLAASIPFEAQGSAGYAPESNLDEEPEPASGELRLRGFISKPEIQKLNRNSIFVFVNGRLVRDRLIQHALTEAYRNILPPTVFPVVLLSFEMPCSEVDANVHPSKTEVRFRRQQFVHDFTRDALRQALTAARPVPQFVAEIRAHPTAARSLTPGSLPAAAPSAAGQSDFALTAPAAPPQTAHLDFQGSMAVEANAAVAAAQFPNGPAGVAGLGALTAATACAPAIAGDDPVETGAAPISSLRPLGQIRDSFILAVNGDGLWIVDQHVAHERVLFEKVLRQRGARSVESQRLLMPLILELTPAQQAVFTEISDELRHNGFEVEPFGARTIAVKTAPAGVDACDIERMLGELLDQFRREEQELNMEAVRARIAASIACHAAIKVNTSLEQNKMEWLLAELAKTACPMTCPHGRPVVLRYSFKDIQRAFKRL
ncbi:MAG: DNA mismatch repair endonuclease MutL [Acidobacteria bacterium]|nr:DNA mismatch repair endonuclease MutL [Acidobacteriota bacterium]